MQKNKASLIAASGAALCGAGLVAAAFLETDSSLLLLVLSQVLTGSGIAFFSLANTTIIIDSGGKQAVGQTAALTGAMRTAGQLLSMIFITVAVSWFLGSEAITVSTLAGFMQSMKTSLIFFGMFNIVGIALTLAQNKNLDSQRKG